MRRAAAYSNSCLQVVLVYLHPFCCNSLLKCVTCCSQNIAEKSLVPILGVQGRSRSLMLNYWKLVSSYCYSIVNNKSTSICNNTQIFIDTI